MPSLSVTTPDMGPEGASLDVCLEAHSLMLRATRAEGQSRPESPSPAGSEPPPPPLSSRSLYYLAGTISSWECTAGASGVPAAASVSQARRGFLEVSGVCFEFSAMFSRRLRGEAFMYHRF